MNKPRNAALRGASRLKLGIFAANCSSGTAATTIPGRWSASWEDNLKLAQLADAGGIDFMLPLARWRGYGGGTDFEGAILETITWACGLLAQTKRLNVFGNLGLGILQAPLANFTQNDVLLYGLAGIYQLNDRVNLVGEVNGAHSTRKTAPLGTEDFSAARLGAQIRALGLRFNAAGVFGLSNSAPKTGLTIGVTYDWEAFEPIK